MGGGGWGAKKIHQGQTSCEGPGCLQRCSSLPSSLPVLFEGDFAFPTGSAGSFQPSTRSSGVLKFSIFGICFLVGG